MGGVLRFTGTNPGYNAHHSDEGVTYSAAASMIKNGNLDPLRYDYPGFVPLVNYVFFKVFFIPLWWGKFLIEHVGQILDGTLHFPIAPLEAKRIFQVNILGEREIHALFWGRYVTALFSLGNVLLTYLLAKKLFNKRVALIAAFLLAFNFKHVVNSHIGLPDIYNAFFLLLAALFSYRLWEDPNKKNYLLAGILAGLSFSVKYQFFGVIPLVTTHILISLENKRIDFKKLFNPYAIMAGLLIPFIFILLNPYHFLYLEKTIAIVKGVSQKYGMGTNRLNLFPLSFLYHHDLGPIQFILSGLGLIFFTWIKKVKAIPLLLTLGAYSFVFLYYSTGGFYIRNLITITPLLLIFSAVLISFLYEKFGRIAPTLLLLTAIIVPGRNAIVNSYYYTKPWGYDELRSWVAQNLPEGIKLGAHPFDGQKGNFKNAKRTEFELRGNYSLAEHKEEGAEYALINLDWAGNSFYFWMGYGFNQLPIYWSKPVDMLRNTFHGVAAEELFRYQVFSTSKPWQAADSGLVLAKIPVWPETSMQEMLKFNFDTGLENWREVIGNNEDLDYFTPDQSSIKFDPNGVRYPGIRIVSTAIPVKPGHLYKVKGDLKTKDNLDRDVREGFIRVDFYNNDKDFDKVGTISSVSSRVWGSSDWVEKTVVERAPEDSIFMTVSFGVYETTRTTIWLDNVSIQESLKPVEDITLKPPYIKRKIDLNLLYPNSHGNL